MGVKAKGSPPPPRAVYQVLGKCKELFPMTGARFQVQGIPIVSRKLEEVANSHKIPKEWIERRLGVYLDAIGYNGYLNNIFLEKLETIIDSWISWELCPYTWYEEELKELRS